MTWTKITLPKKQYVRRPCKLCGRRGQVHDLCYRHWKQAKRREEIAIARQEAKARG